MKFKGGLRTTFFTTFENRSKPKRYNQGRGIPDVDDLSNANGNPYQNL